MACPNINNTTIKGTSAVSYDSTPLPCTDVNTCDNLNTVLAKFDAVICNVKANVDSLTEDVLNITEDVMVITEDVINIQNQLNICCPTTTTTSSSTSTSTTTSTTTVAPTTTTTTTVEPTTTTTTSSSSTSTTTSTTSSSTTSTTSTTTSTSSTTTTTTTAPPLIQCVTYEASGGLGFINYTDCNGDPASYEYAGGPTYTFCALEDTVTADPGVTITFVGIGCDEPTTTTTTTSSTPACISYSATSSGGGPGSVFYIDCVGASQDFFIENETIDFCAQEGSVSVTAGIGLVNNGPCETECISFYAEGAGFAGDVYFIDCNGNPGSFPVAIDEITGIYCGKLGTITSTGPIISIIGPCAV